MYFKENFAEVTEVFGCHCRKTNSPRKTPHIISNPLLTFKQETVRKFSFVGEIHGKMAPKHI